MKKNRRRYNKWPTARLLGRSLYSQNEPTRNNLCKDAYSADFLYFIHFWSVEGLEAINSPCKNSAVINSLEITEPLVVLQAFALVYSSLFVLCLKADDDTRRTFSMKVGESFFPENYASISTVINPYCIFLIIIFFNL